MKAVLILVELTREPFSAALMRNGTAGYFSTVAGAARKPTPAVPCACAELVEQVERAVEELAGVNPLPQRSG